MAAFSIIGREGSVPVHVWAKTLDDKSREQLLNTASLPFVFHHVAAMPDVHAGLGATIGSVIATEGAVIPSAVGVDIGCGMRLARLNFRRCDLDDRAVRAVYEAILRHRRRAPRPHGALRGRHEEPSRPSSRTPRAHGVHDLAEPARKPGSGQPLHRTHF